MTELKPYYEDEFITLYNGDVREVLPLLPEGIVQTCVTSPPYFGLRDYGTAEWEGGDSDCDHVADAGKTKKFGNSEFNKNRPSREATKLEGYYFKDICGRCGAKRIDRQIGLEPTPREFVAAMLNVFGEVKRVLRKDGTLWLNLGDSYNAGRDGGHPGGKKQASLARHDGISRSGANVPGLKPKDLIGIPWRVAFALQEAGWYLRQDIIWAKKNGMPESVKDRCTRSHEYIFLLTKNEKYFFDHIAIQEPANYDGRKSTLFAGGVKYGEQAIVPGTTANTFHTQPRERWQRNASRKDRDRTVGNRNGLGASTLDITQGSSDAEFVRNKRDVWHVALEPLKEAHFAAFPTKLIEPCILAGSGEGSIVLDPFAGAGTTLVTAKKMGRKAIGIELNPDYCELIVKRIKAETAMPLFD